MHNRAILQLNGHGLIIELHQESVVRKAGMHASFRWGAHTQKAERALERVQHVGYAHLLTERASYWANGSSLSFSKWRQDRSRLAELEIRTARMDSQNSEITNIYSSST